MNSKIKAIEEAIKSQKWLAVLRTNNCDQALWAADVAISAGLSVLELTFTIPDVVSVLKSLKKKYPQQIIGIGTITTLEQARSAVTAGADFCVSPHTDAELIKHLAGTLYIPGAFTPSEVLLCHKLGSNWCKIFPANVYGPAGFKTLLGPLPSTSEMNYVVTGGVTESNSRDYLKAGACAVGVGSNVFSDQALQAKDEHHIQKSIKNWHNSFVGTNV